MSERDSVHDYRPGPASEAPLEPGERELAVFLPDATRYWRDHVRLALFFIIVVAVAFVVLGKTNEIWIGALGVILAIGFRAVFFRSESFARRWRLTDRRLLGPQGRVMHLLEITTIRHLMGDVQVVTKSGAKHLIRHMADPEQVSAAILAAREARRGAVE